MEEQTVEDLDGSRIKPVSSLLSHFEQMAQSSTKAAPFAPRRPISPRPTPHNLLPPNLGVPSVIPFQPVVDNKSNQPQSNRTGPLSLNPSKTPLLSSLAPAVLIEPPSSPPKTIDQKLLSQNASSLLPVVQHLNLASPGPASPRPFKIPSRPQTPLLEFNRPRPSSRAHPPEPPPPRRSGEIRREPMSKPATFQPPSVNRAEKPITSGILGTAEASTTRIKLDRTVHAGDRRSMNHSSRGSPKDQVENPFSVQSSQLPQSRMMRVDPDESGLNTKLRHPEVDFKNKKPELPIRPPSHIISATSRTPADMNVAAPPVIPLSTKPPLEVGDNRSPIPPKRNVSITTHSESASYANHRTSGTVARAVNGSLTERREIGQQKDLEPNLSNSAIVSLTKENINLTAPAQIEYPNSSKSNRRPPLPNNHICCEIQTRSETRLMDVCGDFICTAGGSTKVWNLTDGNEIITIPHLENVRITSLSFRANSHPEDEDLFLWLGNNSGEITEVDVKADGIIRAINNTSHTRREVVKIHRHHRDMWTLDDSGVLNVWGSDGQGISNIVRPSATYRVPRSSTFSMVIGDELWYATGKDLRIFLPTVDGRSPFQLLQRPISMAGMGDITSGALIHSRPDNVYLGHSDGKVSIYSRRSYECIATVAVSIYKINSLAGVGNYLWAAYNTGMIHVFDTTPSPWIVKKEWRAHLNPVLNLVVDRSCMWKLNRLLVSSLGQDNVIRHWDGLLQDDWLEAEMQNEDTKFCNFEEIRAMVLTWNAGASTPRSLSFRDKDATFFPSLLTGNQTPEILVFGFQELVDLDDKKTTAKNYFKSKKKDPHEQEHMSHQYRDWRDYLVRCLDASVPRHDVYHLIHSASLVGLFTCIFVSGRIRDRITNMSATEVKRGMGGRMGNKGALVLRFIIDDTSLCFVNCHLAAGQTQTKDRNLDIAEIFDNAIFPVESDVTNQIDNYVGGGDGSMILDHEVCIWNGDLNYRIDTMTRDAVISAVKAGNLTKLLERDQLLGLIRKRPAFRLRVFEEMPITFAPTYKYDVGTDTYDSSEKRRAPAWCDRILFRGRSHERLQQLSYVRHEVQASDHRPVSGLFRIMIKRVISRQREIMWKKSQNKFADFKRHLMRTMVLDFLSSVCGLDPADCRRLLERAPSFRSPDK